MVKLYWCLDRTFKHRRAGCQLLNSLRKDLFYSRGGLNNLRTARLSVLYRHYRRRPFITSDITSGGRLALGPSGMLPGDHVALSVEFFRIIGEAYVYGIMDGEAIAMGHINQV